jgi:hypothetical protein
VEKTAKKFHGSYSCGQSSMHVYVRERKGSILVGKDRDSLFPFVFDLHLQENLIRNIKKKKARIILPCPLVLNLE